MPNERAVCSIDGIALFFPARSTLRVLQLSPIWRVASGAPFNISIGGMDRNLDDVSNDRPNYSGDLRAAGVNRVSRLIRAWSNFSVPPIGQVEICRATLGVGRDCFCSI